MKNRSWILLLTILALLCGILGCFLLSSGDTASHAQIYSQGELVKTVDLAVPQVFTVTAPGGGSNTITVKDRKIAVTSASCPDHYCMHRGFQSSGAPIICLPNALEIRFLSAAGPDISIG